jgi:hypothetical protein
MTFILQRSKFFLFVFILLLTFLHGVLSYSEIVEKILASVDDRIFTLTDFQIAKKFGLVEIVFGNSKLDDKDYLNKLIDSELIYREALLLKMVDVDNQEPEKLLDNIKKRTSDEYIPTLKKFDITEGHLLMLIREKLIAKKHYDMRKSFFEGFGGVEGEKKFIEWLQELRQRATVRIVK